MSNIFILIFLRHYYTEYNVWNQQNDDEKKGKL